MSLFGSRGLKYEHFYKLKERFDSIITGAGKKPEDFRDYFRNEVHNIAAQVLDLSSDEALDKAMEMIETSAKFELMRKRIVRGLLDGTI